MTLFFSNMPTFAAGKILKHFSWHFAVNSDVKHTVDGMGVHDVVVHDVGMHDMSVHDVAVYYVAVHDMGVPGMAMPGMDVYKREPFFSSKKTNI